MAIASLQTLFTQGGSISDKVNAVKDTAGNFFTNAKNTIANAVPDIQSKLNIGQKLAQSNDIQTDAIQDDWGWGNTETAPDAVKPEDTSKEQSEAQDNSTLTFPLDLRSAREYATFNFRSYENRALTVYKGMEEKSQVTICLPLPSQLAENFASSYDPVSLGAFIGTNSDIIMKGLNDIGGLENIFKPENKERLKSMTSQLGQNISSSQSLAYGMWQLADAITPGRSVTSALSRGTGVIPNPYLVQVFQGIGFREFNFSWKLHPNNEKESKVLRKILYELKTRMLPGISSGQFFMTFPDHCVIKLTPNVFDIQECVLTSCTINHAPNGPAFYKNDETFEYDVSCSFREIKLVTRETVREWEKGKDQERGIADAERNVSL